MDLLGSWRLVKGVWATYLVRALRGMRSIAVVTLLDAVSALRTTRGACSFGGRDIGGDWRTFREFLGDGRLRTLDLDHAVRRVLRGL